MQRLTYCELFGMVDVFCAFYKRQGFTVGDRNKRTDQKKADSRFLANSPIFTGLLIKMGRHLILCCQSVAMPPHEGSSSVS